MKALVFEDIKKMEYREVSDPVLSMRNNVLVRISAVGICGSDIQGYLGVTGRRIPPMIMGHEMSGIVESVLPGSDNPDNLCPGDAVVILPFINCGSCMFCKEGKTNFCNHSLFYYGILSDNGGMCDRISIDAGHLVRIRSETDMIQAALSEPFAVAYSGAKKVSCNKDKDILLIGAGTIGLFVLIALRSLGFTNVVVADINPRRLEIAKKIGASDVMDTGSIQEYIEKKRGGIYFSAVVDAVGFASTYEIGFASVENGGELIWIGNASKTFELKIPQVVMRNIAIKGSFIYNEQEIREVIRLIDTGKVDLSMLVECVAPMSEGPKVFKDLAIDKKDVIKAVLVN